MPAASTATPLPQSMRDSLKDLQEPVHSSEGNGDYGMTVHSLFEAQAERTPAADALVCDAVHLSYGELRAWSRGISLSLREKGVCQDEVIGLCFDKRPAAYAAILGVLGSGSAYLPVDPSW